MKRTNCLFIIALLALSLSGKAQDSARTTETKVADLLARMPATSQEVFNTQMQNMLALGEQGWDMICQHIVAPGTGDDTRARYAISGMSCYLSDKPVAEKIQWEKECLKYVSGSRDNEVKRYFINQLSYVGSDASVNVLALLMNDIQLYPEALAALEAINTPAAADAVIACLSSDNCPGAAHAINALIRMGHVDETMLLIKWYEKGDTGTKKAALSALASGGTEEALPVLYNAAKASNYRWDTTDALTALIMYAKTIGLKGDVRGMDKIINTVLSECTSPETGNYRLAALATATEVKHGSALPLLLKSVDDADITVRRGIVRLALTVPGHEATRKWISKYTKADDPLKADIIYMLGERGDTLAVPLVKKAMQDKNSAVSNEAVIALARLQGARAVDPIIAWIQMCDNEEGLITAETTLTTILDSKGMEKVAIALRDSKGYSTGIFISLLSRSGKKDYFEMVLPFASSTDIEIRTAALRALINLASEKDQTTIIGMITSSDDPADIELLQQILSVSANSINDKEHRSDEILAALEKGAPKNKLIPVLAMTGGDNALFYVQKEFLNGDAQLRELCFATLASWCDYSASEAMYDICRSGNKSYEKAALDSYLRQVSSAPVSSETKLLLYKKIAPWNIYPDSKADMIVRSGDLRLYEAFLFVLPFLDDIDQNVRLKAARALENIALPPEGGSTGLYGTTVRKGLEKAVATLDGPESDYDKERIRKYILTMPDDDVAQPATAIRNMTPEEKNEGFVALFNGYDLNGWTGDTINYKVKDGCIVVTSGNEFGGNLYTVNQYSDFIFRFEFRLTPGANNGLGIRAPLEGDAAYLGMELQILDNTDPIYASLKPYQYHGSVYGVIPARRDYLNPVGEWNYEEVVVDGTKIKVVLNGTVIVNGDIADARDNGTLDQKEHPGLKNNTGHIGFLGHGSVVSFRNIRIKTL